MIHLWDELKSFILSSKYDPLDSGKGEAGMQRDDSTLSSLSSASASRCNDRSPSRRGKANDKGDGGTIRTCTTGDRFVHPWCWQGYR